MKAMSRRDWDRVADELRAACSRVHTKTATCKWCGRRRLAKFMANWPGGMSCRDIDECASRQEGRERV
jgi:hypothetical protein